MSPKQFMLVTGNLAAEQRAIVAHSASYGLNHPQISQAPAGATENHDSTPYFSRPIRGLNYFGNIIPTVVTVGYYHALLRSFKIYSRAVAAKSNTNK